MGTPSPGPSLVEEVQPNSLGPGVGKSNVIVSALFFFVFVFS